MRLSDSAFIPEDNANTDYQEYLKWLAKGHIVQPKDEPSLAESNAKHNDEVHEKLKQVDIKSIRGIREYIATKLDAPILLKERELAAIALRATLK